MYLALEIVSISLFLSIILSIYLAMEVSTPYVWESVAFVVFSSVPPMFYRWTSGFERKLVMVFHMLLVTIALYFTFGVNVLLQEKYSSDDWRVVWSSLNCILYSLTIVFGHFISKGTAGKRYKKVSERNDDAVLMVDRADI